MNSLLSVSREMVVLSHLHSQSLLDCPYKSQPAQSAPGVWDTSSGCSHIIPCINCTDIWAGNLCSWEKPISDHCMQPCGEWGGCQQEHSKLGYLWSCAPPLIILPQKSLNKEAAVNSTWELFWKLWSSCCSSSRISSWYENNFVFES